MSATQTEKVEALKTTVGGTEIAARAIVTLRKQAKALADQLEKAEATFLALTDEPVTLPSGETVTPIEATTRRGFDVDALQKLVVEQTFHEATEVKFKVDKDRFDALVAAGLIPEGVVEQVVTQTPVKAQVRVGVAK